MSHTNGRLEVRQYDGSMGSIDSEHGFMVAQAAQILGDTIDHQTRIANTRRLVACWNSCDGLPTDLLEQMVNPTSTYTALMKQRDSLVKERDELVNALRMCADYLPELIGAWDWKNGVLAGGADVEYQTLVDDSNSAYARRAKDP